MTEQEIMEKLKGFDTPSITNVVATYPDNPLCLGLYEPWFQNWYTDQTIKCIYPELGRLVGYAVTVVYGIPDPGFKRLGMGDLVAAIGKSKKPVIIALKQDFPEEIKGKVGLCGGNMTTTFKQAGAIGVVTDGPSRDVDEIRPMGFQYMMTGVTAGHGGMAIKAVNVPVSIAGMDVAPGEIIHMDENGACKFPADRMAEVLKNVEQLVKNEEAQRERVMATKSFEELLSLFAPKK
jgi:4-hydroxy-4-methyl-2-oxoglutarate aldolase